MTAPTDTEQIPADRPLDVIDDMFHGFSLDPAYVANVEKLVRGARRARQRAARATARKHLLWQLRHRTWPHLAGALAGTALTVIVYLIVVL